MNRLFANRALGILKCFLMEKGNEVDIWLLPATCCFSVPFLFKSLKINVEFYDFGFDIENLMAYQNTKNKKIGLLLVDYFGVKWSDHALDSLGSKFDCLIHDACLSDIDFEDAMNPNVDLKIYSTGKGKTVDLNGGALAYSKLPISLRASSDESINSRYLQLDTYWKKIVLDNEPFDVKALEQVWVDTGTDDVPKDYEKNAKEKLEMLMQHRKEIVSIYEENLPSSFKNFFNGAWRYSFLVSDSKVFFAEIKKVGLFASNHYANVARYIDGNFVCPKSDLIEKHIVNLFSDLNISKRQAIEITAIIKSLYQNKTLLPLNMMNEVDYAI